MSRINAASTTTKFNITGGGVDETVAGSNGADTLSGGAGADTLTGNGGADSILGGAGADVITAGAGDDVITGGECADVITGGAGNDNITGGVDADTYVGGFQGESTAITASSFNGTKYAANDTVTFGNGVDVITDFHSTAGGVANHLVKAAANDKMLLLLNLVAIPLKLL